MSNLRLLFLLLSSLLLAPWAGAQLQEDAAASEPAPESSAESASEAPIDLAAEASRVAEDPVGYLTALEAQVEDWLAENGLSMVMKVVVFVVLMLLTKLVAGLAEGLVRRAIQKSRVKVSDLLTRFAINTTRRVVLFLGLLLALGTVGISVGPFLAGFGVVGFVVGFALQETMGNFAAGVMILLYRPFDVGDTVTAGGVTGKVEDMSLVNTTFLTPDNQTILVPNGKIWGDTIVNVTANPTRRVDLIASIAYEEDLGEAEAILRKLCADHPKVLAEPETVVRLGSLGESSVDFQVRPWARTEDYWDVHFDLLRSIKVAFDAAGISIPYPQRQVHVVRIGMSDEEAQAAAEAGA
jgi:small conductance mechanosensitive channel